MFTFAIPVGQQTSAQVDTTRSRSPSTSRRSVSNSGSPYTIHVVIVCCVTIAVFVLVCESFLNDRPNAPQPALRSQSSAESNREAWAIALRSGDGYDWIKLSDRDKLTLCLKVAETLGSSDQTAWAYHDFLDGFYQPPNKQPISEAIAIYQALINRGAIEE